MSNMQYDVAILSGGGNLPLYVVRACLADDLKPLVISFKGQPKPNLGDLDVDVVECGLGQVGKVLNILRDRSIRNMCMVGYLSKPSLFDLRIDMTGLKLINKLRTKHDDALLRAVCDFFESEGVRITAAHELCPSLLAPKGMIAGGSLTESQMSDIALGVDVVSTLGKLDVGQAAIVKDGVVLGVEGVEGTEALIERCAPLRGKKAKGGILVKLAKPQQTLKVDMPTVGIDTVHSLSKHGYEGMAVLAGKTLMLEQDDIKAKAKKLGVFVYGVSDVSE